MSNFYSRFFKVLVLVIGVSFSADCATILDYFSPAPRPHGAANVAGAPLAAPAPAKVESFAWGINPHSGNTLIKSTAGELAATIFSLQFGPHKGKLGAFVNAPVGRVEGQGFMDPLSAKKWVVNQAHTHGITLARA